MIYLALSSNLTVILPIRRSLSARRLIMCRYAGRMVARAPLYRSAAVGPKVEDSAGRLQCGGGRARYCRRLAWRRLHALVAFGREQRIKWGPRTLILMLQVITPSGAAWRLSRLAARAFVFVSARCRPWLATPVCSAGVNELIKELPLLNEKFVKTLIVSANTAIMRCLNY